MGDWTDQGEQKTWEAYSFSYALLTQENSDGYKPSAEVKGCYVQGCRKFVFQQEERQCKHIWMIW